VESINIVHTILNSAFLSNTYIIENKIQKKCVVIDPGLDWKPLEDKIKELSCKPLAIISTHGHFDHIGSVSLLKNKFDIPFYIHKDDLKLSQSANFYLKLAKFNLKIETPYPDFTFKGKRETLKIEDFDFEIYNFPGHSKGSCVINIDKNLFSGDILYKKGLGFNNFPGENIIELRKSINCIFETFSPEMMIYPGHGKPELLGEIRINNLELRTFLEGNQSDD